MAAFLGHGQPKYLTTDQDDVFACGAFRDPLGHWNVKQRLGAIGKHGSIALTERAIRTLKREWVGGVPLIRGPD